MLIVRSAHMSVKSPAKVIVHSKEIYVVSLHDPRTANEFVPILLYKTPCHQKIARQVTVSSLIFCGNRFFGLHRKLMTQLDVSFCIYNLSHSLLPPVVLLETNFLVLNNLLMQLLVCFCFCFFFNTWLNLVILDYIQDLLGTLCLDMLWGCTFGKYKC